MSLSGINPNGPNPLGAPINSRNDVNGQPRLQRPSSKAVAEGREPTPRAEGHGRAEPTKGTVTLSPPPGTDPALWSILTNDERAHFAASGARGPLTYGMASRGQLPAHAPTTARGGRLDVKA